MSGADVLTWNAAGYGSLPAHCEPVDETLARFSSYWNSCVPTYLALFSTLLGSLSIVAWLFAQLPQIYKNFKIRSTAGLSAYFLLVWCLGDTSNLVGALLTGQASWQVIVAAYYSFVDCLLVGQYVWYEMMGKGRKKRIIIEGQRVGRDGDGRGGSETDPLLASQPVNGADRYTKKGNDKGSDQGKGSLNGFKFPALISSSPHEKGIPVSGRRMVRAATPSSSLTPSSTSMLLVAVMCIAVSRASPIYTHSKSSHLSDPMLTASHAEDPKELAGRIISWASTVLYLVSRFPQIIKNYRRKSTAGLSASLFAAAFCGNLFYSSSLLTNPLAWGSYGPYGHNGWAGPAGSDQADWVLSAAPFFLGSAGVLMLDATVGIQFFLYGDGGRSSSSSSRRRPDRHTPRVPVVTETPPTRSGTGIRDGTATPPRSRVLAVPFGGSHQHHQQLLQQQPGELIDEPRSWKRVSGYMRGWVPSFSPGSWSRSGYMASAAAAAGRVTRDRIASGFATPRSRSVSSHRARGIRNEVEEWESRHGTRQGSVVDINEHFGGGGRGADHGHDDDDDDNDNRPLLEHDQDGRYGGL